MNFELIYSSTFSEIHILLLIFKPCEVLPCSLYLFTNNLDAVIVLEVMFTAWGFKKDVVDRNVVGQRACKTSFD